MTAPFVSLEEDREYPEGSVEDIAMREVLPMTLQQVLATQPAWHTEIERSPEVVEEEAPPTTGQALGIEEELTEAEYRDALIACYGDGFPLAKDTEPTDEDWCSWLPALWQSYEPMVIDHLWVTERNRLMRIGEQWISSQNKGKWREPPKPSDQARIVKNLIGPALDMRVELIAEQQPGFRVEPEGSQSQKNMKRAEAMQLSLEYQWRRQRMAAITKSACYKNGTDAVAFLHVYVDPDAGPEDEVLVAKKDETGQEVYEPETQRLGDIATEVFRVEQVRVDPGASATVKPKIWITRRVIAQSTAIKRYGMEVIRGDTAGVGGDVVSSSTTPSSAVVEKNLSNQTTVEEYRCYIEKGYLPQGMMLMIVGKKVVVQPMPLQFGCVPLVRWTDGSTDDAWLPRAIMDGWVPTQMYINGLESRLAESVRKNSGGRIISVEGSIINETLVGSVLSNIQVKRSNLGGMQLGQVVQPFPSFSVGNDLIEARNAAIIFFEQISGWNDATRGSSTGDESGRAILASREATERIFNPPIRAAAEAMSDWGRINIAAMKYLYDTPRMIAVLGDSRPDLALTMQSDDFDGAAEVSVNPETLVPMSKSLRLLLLDQAVADGMMSPEEKRRRSPFAFVQQLDSPDKDQTDRAKRVCEAIRQSGQSLIVPGQPYAILWMDDEAIHQDVLQRELILPDDVDMAIRNAAMERWVALAQQAMFKMGAAPTPTGSAPQQGGGSNRPALSAGEQPFMGTNPGIAAGTAKAMAGDGNKNNQDGAASRFEATAPR